MVNPKKPKFYSETTSSALFINKFGPAGGPNAWRAGPPSAGIPTPPPPQKIRRGGGAPPDPFFQIFKSVHQILISFLQTQSLLPWQGTDQVSTNSANEHLRTGKTWKSSTFIISDWFFYWYVLQTHTVIKLQAIYYM